MSYASLRLPTSTLLPWVCSDKVIAWLKANKKGTPLFVVTLTGASLPTAPTETIERHDNVWIFNCYFLKPINEDNLNMIMAFFESWRKSHLRS